jgi:hypothetical protein
MQYHNSQRQNNIKIVRGKHLINTPVILAGDSTCYAQLMSMPNNYTTVYNGTATITMRQRPVPAVPISIKAVDNNVVSILN